MRESEPEKRRKPLIYIRLTNVQEHLYPHIEVSERRLFCEQPRQMEFRPSVTEMRHVPARTIENLRVAEFPGADLFAYRIIFSYLAERYKGGGCKAGIKPSFTRHRHYQGLNFPTNLRSRSFN